MLKLTSNHKFRFIILAVVVAALAVTLICSKLVSASSENPGAMLNQHESFTASKAISGGRATVHSPGKTGSEFHPQSAYKGARVTAFRSESAEPLRETATGGPTFVYANNDISGANSVTAFQVGDDGRLTNIGTFQTGGAGGGSASAGAGRATVVVAGEFLYASNTASGDITAFTIDSNNGSLGFLNTFSTGQKNSGAIGLAATPNGKLLFASNDAAQSLSIFGIGTDGGLVGPTANIALPGQPDSIKLSSNGHILAITFGPSHQIAIYTVDNNGNLNPAPGSPFTVSNMVTRRTKTAGAEGGSFGNVTTIGLNKSGTILFAALFNGSGMQTIEAFNIADNGNLSRIAGSPFTYNASASGTENLLLSPDDKHLFIASQNGQVTPYDVLSDGTLIPNLSGAATLPSASFPAGLALDRSGAFLFAAGQGDSVFVNRIANDGALTPLTEKSTTSAVSGGQTGSLRSLAVFPSATASIVINAVLPPTISASFNPNPISLGSTTALTFLVHNPNASTLTGVGFTLTLPAGLTVPNASASLCGGGTATLVTPSSISLSGASLTGSNDCQFSVTVTGASVGNFTATTSAVTSNEGGNGNTASASITVTGAPPSIAKAFNPNPIALGATTALTFTITNSNASGSLTGVGFTDTLPAGLTVPNASATVCSGTVTLTAPSTISMTNATVAASNQCQFSVTVTGAAPGQYTNTTSAVTSTNAGTGNSASANLTVASPPTIIKLFGVSSIPLNGTTTLTFNINNPNAGTGLTGVAFTDNLPSGLVVANPANVSNTCNGTVTATPGSGVISLSGGTVAANTGCSVVVTVQGTSPGIKNNTTQVTSTEGGTGNTTNTSITVVGAPVIIKAFGAASIPLNGSTSLTFTIQNNNTVTTLHGVAFTDTFPAGLVVSTPNGLAGSCGGGTITATQATNVVSLSGATIAASSSCTFSINVTGTAAGLQNNTTGNVTSTEGGTGGTASASVTVVAPPSIAKVFNPNPIALGGTTALTFTITNPNASTALNGVGFTDTLPTGLTVVNASATVCSGTVTLTAPTLISMTNATVAANSICQFSVTVTGAAAGQYTNTTSAVTSTNGGTGTTASANLTVASAPLIVKFFGAASIPLNGTTTLSFNINNPNTSVNLTGVAFTDNLPAGLAVAANPNISNTCNGTVTATPGSGVISLFGGTVASNTGCSVIVTVQGTSAGIKNNTTQVTSTEGGTGNTTNTSITVIGPPVIIKAFGAASIPLNGSTGLQFIIQNNNPITNLSGVGFTDTLPAGLVIATPNGLTGTCGAGTITATQGTGLVTLSGGTIAASGSCTFSINVTGTTAGLKNNTTSNVTSIEGGTGGTASASVSVLAPPAITKAFNPTGIAVGAATSLNFVITNPAANAGALNGVAFSDTLPAGLTVPNASATVCGGTVTLTAPSLITMSGATISQNTGPNTGACIFSVTVTGTTAGIFTNTTGNVTSTNGGTGNTASATLNVAVPPTLVKFFGVGTMPINQTTTLNFTVTNPNGTLGLTGIGFTDNLPAGLVVATPNGLSGSCGPGIVTAVAGSNSVSLSGGTVAASSTCTFAINVTGTTAGVKVNTTGPITSNESGPGGTATGSITITQRTTTTSVSFSANPVVSGQTLQVTATVVDTDAGPKSNPSGTVNFSSAAGTDQFNPASCALAPVNNSTTTSSCTVNLSSTTINTHNITAAYAGSAVHAPSSGSSPLTVNKANTSTNLVSSANPSVFGQAVTFTATVSAVAPGAGIPTGTVTFFDGANVIGAGSLNGAGVATFTTGVLSVATHPISAAYGSDANFNGSTSNTVNQVVNKADTSTALVSSVNPSSFGQNVTFTATVTANAPGSGTPTGTVTFLDGATPIGAGTLNGGVATFATAILSVATHPISAAYGSDANFNGSTSNTVNQVVNKATTATALTSSVNPSVFGQPVTFTATVTSTGPAINNPGGSVDRGRRTRTVNPNLVTPSFGIGTPSGTVTFFDGATQIGTATLNGSGVGTFTTAGLSTGSHSITAVYNGDADFLTSTSNVVTQVVNKANTTTALSSNANPSVFGQPVTLTATVAAVAPGAGIPTGTVTFFDGATQIGTATLNGSGVGSIVVSTFSVGSHSITVKYGGDGNFNASQTAAATVQVVNKANTTTVIVANPNPAFVHTTVTFTATIVPVAPGAGVPTGTVQFKDNGVNIGGPVTLVNATASVTESNLTPGNHVITAVYSGDGNFNPSTGTLTGGLNVGFKFVDTTSGNTLIVIPPANGQSGNGTCTWINNGTNIITNSPCGVEFNQQTLRVRSDTPSLNGLFDATTQVGQAILFANGKSFVLNTNSIVLF